MIQAPPGYEPAEPPSFQGGSDADRTALLKLYYCFRVINDALDGDALCTIWDADTEDVFFNSNGHNYYGLHDWLTLWDHYRPKLRVTNVGGSGRIHIVIHRNMGLIVDDHSGHSRVREWIGSQPRPATVDNACSRVTMVCARRNDGWKVFHAHFSITRHEGHRHEAVPGSVAKQSGS
jgi:hypothetical protein